VYGVFEGLADRLNQIFKEVRRKGKLSTKDVESALHDIRIALLEADVNYIVVKDFIQAVRNRAVGIQVSQALNPAQQVIKIVYEELISILGEPVQFALKGEKPRVLLFVGLQGSGKTTAASKLARFLQLQGERVMLVAADPYRPAADLQLIRLAEKINIPVFSSEATNATSIVCKAIEKARKNGTTVLVVDSAGRSQLDNKLMQELSTIANEIKVTETLLVVDGMTGQEAVKIAEGFKSALPISGLFISKMDGDARGGAAISIRKVTGIPIQWIGTGETIDAIEYFNPRRLADRILGMGDVLGLIEKAEANLDQKQTSEQLEKLKKGKFTLEDYAEQMQQVKKMGSVSQLLEMLPGTLSRKTISSEEAEKKLIKSLSIIQSMTLRERPNPDLLNANRRRRIATGSGNEVQDVNRLIKEFKSMQVLLKIFGKLDKKTIMSLLR